MSASSQPQLNEAESFKLKGNELFMQGNAASAIAAYRAGIEAAKIAVVAEGQGAAHDGTTTPTTITAASALLAVLCSNCSHALTESGAMEDAVAVSLIAVAADPTLKKGWLRLLRAQHLSRRTFEAFVTLHAHLAPGLSLKELGALCGPLSDTVADAVGVTGLHTAFRLRADASGGVSTVAADNINEGRELFVERRWDHEYLAAPASATDNIDNEAHLTHFSKQLIALLAASKDAGASDSNSVQAWADVNRALAGSWPRRLEDVPEQQQTAAISVVEKVLSAHMQPNHKNSRIQPDTFSSTERTSIAHLALICRYNCFHSGFFRACALLNHSCLPNAAMKFVQRDQSVHMLVVSPIKTGDDITVKYLTDADYLEGVGRRRELLWNSWLFWCTCKRCTLDDQSTSTCEFRKCSSGACTEYVHCPTPGAEASSTVDPNTTSERLCSSCGTVTRWTIEERNRIYAARTAAAQMEGDIAGISSQLVRLRESVAPLVHSDHWIHRVLLYHFGVKATQAIGHWFQGLLSEQLLLSAVAPLALRSLSNESSVERKNCGGGLLVALVDLWDRIVPFYPWNEGWALHCAIVRLLVINLCCPNHVNALPEDAALERLCIHAPFIGKQEQSSCFKLIQSFRGGDKSNTVMKLMKALKKIFS